MKMRHLLIYLQVFVTTSVLSQVTSNIDAGKKLQSERDSMKQVEYPYILPILGKKATKAGFQLPYSAGISLNYIWQTSDIVIDNLQVGFNNGPMYNLDQIVRFNDATSTGGGFNFRPDVWVLPFLNVYGIFARSNLSTEVGFDIWVPDQDSWTQVLTTSTKAEFEATTVGIGLTPTIGVRGFFLAFDMNTTWSDIDALKEPAFAFVFDPRAGKNFKFKKPEMALAAWVGGFRLKINTGTTGQLPLSELFETGELDAKIDNALISVDQKQQNVDNWWNSLTPTEQRNPINIAKHNAANLAIETASKILVEADEAVSNIGTSTVEYSLDKKQKQMWNFLIGGQFQYNMHWMIRAEVGVFGNRSQFLGGLQYRFGL